MTLTPRQDFIQIDAENTYAIPQGATFSWHFQRVENDGTTPIPFPAGTTALMQIRKSAEDETVLYELTDGEGITITEATGELDLEIPAEETAAFTWFRAVYDIILTYPTAAKERFIEGAIEISPAVSREGEEA